ncbi:MAG: Lrp/AsnC ligand binding domain-containing protein [Candidatus Hodarchaeales archaeon]|jgi:DNA-binding Lrp family transcriptional regulator
MSDPSSSSVVKFRNKGADSAMSSAYVMINTRIGTEKKVLKEIKNLSRVKEATHVYGDYNIVCRVESNNKTSLDSFILEKIRKMDMIRATLTLIVA